MTKRKYDGPERRDAAPRRRSNDSKGGLTGWLKSNVGTVFLLVGSCAAFIGSYSVNNYRMDMLQEKVDKASQISSLPQIQQAIDGQFAHLREEIHRQLETEEIRNKDRWERQAEMNRILKDKIRDNKWRIRRLGR